MEIGLDQMSPATLRQKVSVAFASPNSARLSTAPVRSPKRKVHLPAITSRGGSAGGPDHYFANGVRFPLQSLDQKALKEKELTALEVWPAGGNNVISEMTMVGRQHAPDNEFRSTKSVAAKPALLLELEAYIEHALAALPATQRAALSESRLEIYSRVFDRFTEEFSTYSSVLGRIKRQYEGMMAFYQRQVDSMQPLQTRLLELKQIEAEEVRKLEEAHAVSVAAVRRDLDSSEADIATLRSNVNNIQDKIILLKKNLQETDDLCEEQYANNRSVLSSMQTMMTKAKQRPDPRVAKEQQLKQKAELEKAQDQLNKALMSFNKLKQSHKLLVPRIDVETASNELNRVTRNITTTMHQYHELQVQEQKLEEQIRVTKERIEAVTVDRNELVEKTRSFTPRPDWTRLPDFSKDIALEGMSSRNLVPEMYRIIDKLKDELSSFIKILTKSKKLSDTDAEEYFTEDKFFEGLGTEADVPKYLRFKGKVRNKQFKKRDTEMTIKQVMRDKMEYEKANKKTISMPDFYYLWLQKKFGNQNAIVEFGYNLMDALERYSSDPDCHIFYLILKGEASQDVWDRQDKLLDQLLKCMVNVDLKTSNTGKPTGLVDKNNLVPALQQFFASKSDSNFEAVMQALNSDQPGPFVEYKNLFLEDRDGNQGEFVEMIRNQYMNERQEYLDEIRRALEAEGETRLTCGRITAILSTVDPGKPANEWQEHIARGFGVASRDLKDSKFVNVTDFMARLSNGVIERTSKPM